MAIRVVFQWILAMRADESRLRSPVRCQTTALPSNAQGYAIGAFIGLHGQNALNITRIAAGVSFNGPERFAWKRATLEYPTKRFSR
jgi:hypothetical protein